MKISSYAHFGLIALFCWTFSCEGREPFAASEGVVRGFASLRELLKDEGGLRRYRAALDNDLGLRTFHCKALEPALEALLKLDQSVPAYTQALWAPRSLPRLVLYRSGEGSKAGKERWELVAPPRPLHALWVDPSQNRCAGDRCQSAEITAPERWTVALNGSEVYFLFVDGVNQGEGLVVQSLERKDKPYALVSVFGGRRLQQTANFATRKDSPGALTTVLSRFLDSYTQRMRGVVPVTTAFDSYHQSFGQVVRLLPEENTESFVGYFDEFRPGDPLADQVVAVVPRPCFGRKDQKGLNLLAGFGDGNVPTSPLAAGGDPSSLLVNVNSVGEAQALANKIDPELVAPLGQALAAAMPGKGVEMRRKAALVLNLLDGVATEDRPFSSVGAFQRPPSRGLASPSGSGKSAAGASRFDPFQDAFRRGLTDPDPIVRGVSATALADRGNTSPPVRAALKDATRLTPAALGGAPSPISAPNLVNAANLSLGGDTANRAAQRAFDRNFDRAFNDPDPAQRQRAMDRLVEQIMYPPRPGQFDDDIRRRIAQATPEEARRIVTERNAKDCAADLRKKTVGNPSAAEDKATEEVPNE